MLTDYGTGFATRTPVSPRDDDDPEDSDSDDDDEEDASDAGHTPASSPTAVASDQDASTRNENESQPTASTTSSGRIIQPEPSIPTSQPDELGGQETSPSHTDEAVVTETTQPASAGRAQMQRTLGMSVCLIVLALVW